MSYADTLSSETRRKARRHAIMSALCGCISEWVNDSNAIIILFLVLLGGSDSFSLFSSSFCGLSNVFLCMLCAMILGKIGMRNSYRTSVLMTLAAFLMMAAAPVFGANAKYVVIAGALLFNISRPLYTTTWYPMCDNMLRSSERAPFFSTMRFSYMMLNTCLLYGAGRFLGDNPGVFKYQCILVFAGCMALGRMYFMNKMPVDPNGEREAGHFLRGLLSLYNEPRILGLSFYLFALNASIAGFLPLCIIYMKTDLHFGAGTIMTITSARLCGMIIGYITVRFIARMLNAFLYQLATHLMFILVSLSVLFVRPCTAHNWFYMLVIFFLSGMTNSHLMCLTSMRMMELSPKNNRVVAMAFSSGMQNLGTVISTLGATLLLASGALASQWSVFGIDFTKFHFMFILYFLLCLFSMLFLVLVPQQQKE